MSLPVSSSTADRVARIGPGALLARSAGVLLWGLARPESLPVPEPGAEATPAQRLPAAGGALPRILAGGLAVLALAVLAVGYTAWHATRAAVTEFVHTTPGTPLTVTADRLSNRLDGSWWTIFYPGFPGRLDRAAERIREGETDLERLAATYRSERDAVNRRGLPARILAGPDFLAPLDSALAAVRYPWHRGTLVYSEIEQAVRPYRDAAGGEPAKVTATLVQAPPDHALVVTVTGPDGSALLASPPLEVGKSITVPLVPGSRVGLTTLLRPAPGAAYRVETETSFPLAAWPSGELTVPGGGGFQFRFDPEAARSAPPLPALSGAAESEIQLPGGASRR